MSTLEDFITFYDIGVVQGGEDLYLLVQQFLESFASKGVQGDVLDRYDLICIKWLFT